MKLYYEVISDFCLLLTVVVIYELAMSVSTNISIFADISLHCVGSICTFRHITHHFMQTLYCRHHATCKVILQSVVNELIPVGCLVGSTVQELHHVSSTSAAPL